MAFKREQLETEGGVYMGEGKSYPSLTPHKKSNSNSLIKLSNT